MKPWPSRASACLAFVWLCGVQSALAQQALEPLEPLSPFTARYHASYFGLTGQATITLQATADAQWRYTLSVRNPLARIRQTTVFTLVDDALRPLHTLSESRLLLKERIIEGHYDWQARTATWTGDASAHRRGPVALEPGDIDGLLINLAVVRDLTLNRPLQYRMVDGGRATPLEYRIEGNETVTLNSKPVQAVRLARTQGNKEQIAWIAPGLPTPLRLLQRENGKNTLELRLVP